MLFGNECDNRVYVVGQADYHEMLAQSAALYSDGPRQVHNCAAGMRVELVLNQLATSMKNCITSCLRIRTSMLAITSDHLH